VSHSSYCSSAEDRKRRRRAPRAERTPYGAEAGDEEAAVNASVRGEEVGALGVEEEVAALLPAIALFTEVKS
jgi:hypothetical protein